MLASAQAVFWITVDDEITETSTPILARPSRCASGSIICLNQMSRRDPGVRGGSAIAPNPVTTVRPADAFNTCGSRMWA